MNDDGLGLLASNGGTSGTVWKHREKYKHYVNAKTLESIFGLKMSSYTISNYTHYNNNE